MTTILLNIHNAGFYELNSMIIGMGIFIGGMAQIIAGIRKWKKNNTFGTTAFTAYGLFWLSLVALWLIPKNPSYEMYHTHTLALGWYLFMWGLFTLGMSLGTLQSNQVLQLIFFTLTILLFLLAFGDFTGSITLKKLAGYEGIFCGLCAFYSCIAQVLNETHGKTILPLG